MCVLWQILILMQLFDPRGTGQVEYMEVVAWLDPNAVVEVNKQCANTLTKLTYGSQKEKALQVRWFASNPAPPPARAR